MNISIHAQLKILILESHCRTKHTWKAYILYLKCLYVHISHHPSEYSYSLLLIISLPNKVEKGIVIIQLPKHFLGFSCWRISQQEEHAHSTCLAVQVLPQHRVLTHLTLFYQNHLGTALTEPHWPQVHEAMSLILSSLCDQQNICNAMSVLLNCPMKPCEKKTRILI